MLQTNGNMVTPEFFVGIFLKGLYTLGWTGIKPLLNDNTNSDIEFGRTGLHLEDFGSLAFTSLS